VTATPFGSSSWYSIASGPIAASSSSCINRAGYIYCIGGATPSYTSGSYYASSYPGSSWSAITSYPVAMASSSCAAYNNFVYCVGGSTSSSAYTSAVYSSPVAP
jgi:N-acetylneuraminic acid mutarotase